jgi:LysM repeat protein
LRVVVIGGAVFLAACGSAARQTAKSRTVPTQTTVAPTTAPAPPPVTYAIKRGDTLTSIARFFGVSPAAVAAANQLTNTDRLTEGQVLTIPPTPPPQVAVAPPDGISGQQFTFTLSGAKAGENVTFQIVSPSGRVFGGQPHTASQDGVVSAGYRSAGDDPGTYRVVASGDRGTSLETTYRLLG